MRFVLNNSVALHDTLNVRQGAAAKQACVPVLS